MKQTTEIDFILGQNIVNHRVACGMSRKELAGAIGVTHQQLQKYEKGINRITVSRLYDISNTLKLPISQLIEISESSFTNTTDNRAIADIMKYINKITDKTKLDAIKNLIRSISVEGAA